MTDALAFYLRNYRYCQEGSVAIGFALFAMLVIVCGGMAMDYVLGSKHRANLQAAADAAAIATAHEIPLVNSTAPQIEALAKSYVLSNFGFGNAVAVSASMLQKTGVQIDLTMKWEPVFGHLVFDDVTPIKVSATAQVYGTGTICLIGLDTSKQKAIHLKKRAKLSAKGCGVFANSTSAKAIRVEDNSSIEAALTCSVGGIDGLSKAHIDPKPETDCPQITDPLANRQPPPIGPCDHTKLKIKDQTRTLSPGTYCGGGVAPI